jgi:hypothetical protein
VAITALLIAILASFATDMHIVSWNLVSSRTTFLDGPSREVFEELSIRVSKLEGLISSSELCEGLMQRYSKDHIGRRDFALRTGGSLVIGGLTTQTSEPASYHPFWPFNFGSQDRRRNLPDIALTHNPQLALCWKVDTPHGQLGISLPETILVTHVTIDHVSRDFTSHINLAPRTIYIWGVLDGEDNLEKRQILIQGNGEVASVLNSRYEPAITGGLLYIPLARLVYDIYAASHVQTFPVMKEIVDQHMEFKEVVVEFVDNWGGSTTCLHRVRIHGLGKDELVT